jgi:hypothetical protein
MPFDPRNFEVVDDEMAAVFRAMSGAQRLKIANDMWVSAFGGDRGLRACRGAREAYASHAPG